MSPANDPTRQRILEAAGQVFAEKGFEETSIREICGRANANIAAVNYHFGDKFALYVDAVKQAHCQQGPPPDFPWTAETTPAQKLSDFIHQMMTMMLDRDRPTWHLELMLREMARPTKVCEDLVREFIGPMFTALLGIINEFVPPEVPLFRRQLLGFSIVGQCLLYKFHRPIGRLLIGEGPYEAVFDVASTAAHVTAFSVAGIEAVAREFQTAQPKPTRVESPATEAAS